MKRIVVSLIAIITFQFIIAQPITLYYMNNVEQSIYTNPARMSSCCFTFSIPTIDMNFFSYPMKFSYLFSQDNNGTFFLDFDKIYSNLYDRNYFLTNMQMGLINFGFRYKQIYFHYDYSIKNDIYFEYPRDLFKFLAEGNKSGTINLGNWKLDIAAYTQSRFTLAYRPLKNLYIGTSVKIYKGLFNINTQNFDLNVTVDTSSNYPLTITANYNFNVSSPFTFQYDNNNKLIVQSTITDTTGKLDTKALMQYLTKSKNSGIGFDFGVIYKPIEQLEISASIIDLGSIKWRYNPTTFKADSISIKFEGVDIIQYLNDTTYMDKLIDSLMSKLYPTLTNESYKTSMLTKIYLGIAYTPVHWATIGFNYRGVKIEKGNWWKAYNFALSLNLGYGWNLTGSYTIYPKSKNTFGFGTALKLGALQMFFVTDNIVLPNFIISSYTSKDVPYTDNKATNWLKNTQLVNFMFGLNIRFGCKDWDDYGLLID